MYTHRPARGDADFVAALALTSRLWRQQAPYAYWLPGDMTWWRAATPDDSAYQTLELWYAGDSLVAASWQLGSAVDIIADQTHPGLYETIVAHLCESGTVDTLYAFSRDVGRQAVLLTHGFVAGPPEFRVHLCNPATAPHIPLKPGWSVGPLPPGPDATAARAAAQRSAFQSTKMTTERYAYARSLPGYSPEWDTILTDPSGAIVAFVTVWYDAASNTALFEPVGCVHEHKRTGATRMLFGTLLARLAAAGVTTASVLSLPVSAETPAGLFYEACGFRPIDHIHSWQRIRNDS
ncbi:MAG: hypothetical protein RLZZ297_882 [Chloroflexota bacterium]